MLRCIITVSPFKNLPPNLSLSLYSTEHCTKSWNIKQRRWNHEQNPESHAHRDGERERGGGRGEDEVNCLKEKWSSLRLYSSTAADHFLHCELFGVFCFSTLKWFLMVVWFSSSRLELISLCSSGVRVLGFSDLRHSTAKPVSSWWSFPWFIIFSALLWDEPPMIETKCLGASIVKRFVIFYAFAQE